jgi:hypothetical protein
MRPSVVPFPLLGTLLLLVGIGSMAFGCSKEETSTNAPKAKEFSYPKDNELRLSQIQVKATHNSYHIAGAGVTVEELQYTHQPLTVQLEKLGVRSFELDTHLNKDEDIMEIYHIAFIDEGTTCRKFTDCLQELKTWSDKNLAHPTIFIQIEPKDGVFPEEMAHYVEVLERDVLTVWPRERVLTPDDVQKDSPTLRDAVLTRGWPTLGESRGKIAFFINEKADIRTFYTYNMTSLKGRLMFAEGDSTNDPWAALFILNDPISDFDAIQSAVKSGYMVRTRADGEVSSIHNNDRSKLEKALASGGQLVSTDYPTKIAPYEYELQLPGGTPARCNPISAPSDCQASDIENPAFIEP